MKQQKRKEEKKKKAKPSADLSFCVMYIYCGGVGECNSDHDHGSRRHCQGPAAGCRR